MKTYKLILLILILVFNIQCTTYKPLSNDERLLRSVSTKEFKSFSDLCNKKEDKILIYNNLDDFKDSLSLNMDCNKKVLIIKSKILIDVNSSKPIHDNHIILYKYDMIGNKYKLFFLETLTNSTFMMIFNKENKLLSSEKSFF